MPIRKGQILGEGYRLIHPLKVGRFTQVWLGRSMSSGEQVAIKILEIERVPRLRAERFRREMKIVSSLDHRNICKVFDAGQTGGGLYFFVMPMLIGRPLSEVLKERSLDVQRVIDIASQVLSGLEAAHKARIVHRDVKPSNIFITRNIPGRSDGRVKLIDFGISKALNSAARLTDTGVAIGTVHYMSPE